MKTYFIQTFGCQMNKSDSERIAFVLEKMGFSPASDLKKCQLLVVNMCSIRQSAVDRVYGLVEIVKKQNPKAKTILTGCVVKEDLANFRERFDYVLPIKSLPSWPQFLAHDKFFGFANTRRMREDEALNIKYLKTKAKYDQTFSVEIPISYGCNNFCTYCVVPYTRGPLICRSPKDIIAEAKQAVKNGAKEIWLLGQNVNDYKSKCQNPNVKSTKTKSKIPKEYTFSNLIQEIDKIPGDFWIRFTSPHPAQVNDAFILSLAKCQKLAPYINLPVQSGDDKILKAMNRPYTSKQYLLLVKKLRGAFKKYRKGDDKYLAISTDTIVGFPNETKKQFANTCALYKKVNFDMAYLAEYSARRGTPAAKLDNIPNNEKKTRFTKLNNILAKSVLANNKKFVGKTLKALVFERKPKTDIYFAKTAHYKTVRFESNNNLIGQFVNLKIIKAQSFILKGEYAKK